MKLNRRDFLKNLGIFTGAISVMPMTFLKTAPFQHYIPEKVPWKDLFHKCCYGDYVWTTCRPDSKTIKEVRRLFKEQITETFVELYKQTGEKLIQLQFVNKEPGQAGPHNDPLNQYWTMGWKAWSDKRFSLDLPSQYPVPLQISLAASPIGRQYISGPSSNFGRYIPIL